VKKYFLIKASIFLMLLMANSCLATKYYVKQGAGGGNNGTNWINAYTDLQSALIGATSGDVIWVAKGTYKPTFGTDRTISFVIPAGVEVYGGFFGNEISTFGRNFITNETILSGDIYGPDSTDNSYHVIYTTEAGANTIVDGFTIQDGVANGSVGFNIGGGWYNYDGYNSAISSPQIANCIFKNNFAYNGGGIHHSSIYGTCSPVYTNVTFVNNSAGTNGGAVYHAGGTAATNLPVFNNCSFTGNTASDGGAIYTNDAVSIEYNNCSFTLNQSTLGGAIHNSIYAPDIHHNYVNCTFTNNKALSLGGAVFVSCAGIGNTQSFSGYS
jgi:predicted outer membrane repeat protein